MKPQQREPDRVAVNGRRHYRLPNGSVVPSVTTVLDATADRRALDAWRLRVGDVEADRVRDAALARGTAFHDRVATFLSDPFCDPESAEFDPDDPMWTAAVPLLRHIDEVLLVESMVYDPLAGYAGTLDLLCRMRGTRGRQPVLVVDWKTADDYKRLQWVQDFKLQGAAYAGALRETDGVVVDGAVIGIVTPGKPMQEVWTLARDIDDDLGAFKQRLAAYRIVYGGRDVDDAPARALKR